ncbi:hypothetical protein E2493_17185 [Sphingomonas parva]|uniref:YcaO domain-containing protein n=1 Tax=Sphingomonas parva TaxID=2555898 RepID=A0A4Y8ZNJ6_9SPHN|nr:YcaO-like family protein [Sphingomonas parva]TFI57027.1 hypothetical protein E2493_17185 [Sphingomonas parva]
MGYQPAPASLRRLRDMFDDLVDPRVGIIQYVSENAKEAGAPDFFRYAARASDTKAFCPQSNFDVASAAAATREMALAKTLGEAVERYCAAIFDPAELPIWSRLEAPFPCVDPASFALFAPDQFGTPGFVFEPWHDGTPLRWTMARDLVTGDAVGVPACFVYVPYFFDRAAGEVPIAQPISTGLACHCSIEEATIGGLCEVIERDAFTLTWQGRLSHPRIELSSLSAANRDLVGRLAAAGYRVDLMDATTDSLIPSIVGTLRSLSPCGLPLVVAASTSVDAEDAVGKCLEELAHTERYMWQLRNTTPDVPFVAGHTNVVDQVTHLRFWNDAERLALARWLWASDRVIDFADLPTTHSGSPAECLQHLLRRITETGHRPLAVDLSTPDVAEAGLRVVRAIIPGYHPLHMGHIVRARGGERLWTVPQRLGHRPVEPGGDNPYPHPFP